MIKNKQPYESPDITVTRVELESSICSGSVDFVGKDKQQGVTISSQQVVDMNGTNDFSNNEWKVDN